MLIYILALILKTAVLAVAVEAGIRFESSLKARFASEKSDDDASQKLSKLRVLLYWVGSVVFGFGWWLQSELFVNLAGAAGVSRIWSLAPIAVAGGYYAFRNRNELIGEEPKSQARDLDDGPENEIFDQAA